MSKPKKVILRRELECLERLSNEIGTVLCVDGKKYMFLPYWIEVKDDDHSQYIILHKLDKLPEELRDKLKKKRSDNDNIKSVGT